MNWASRVSLNCFLRIAKQLLGHSTEIYPEVSFSCDTWKHKALCISQRIFSWQATSPKRPCIYGNWKNSHSLINHQTFKCAQPSYANTGDSMAIHTPFQVTSPWNLGLLVPQIALQAQSMSSHLFSLFPHLANSVKHPKVQALQAQMLSSHTCFSISHSTTQLSLITSLRVMRKQNNSAVLNRPR